MPRRARIDEAGVLQHIIIRGIERRVIFDDDVDRAAFLNRFGMVVSESRAACYAWALIPNHAHLLLRSGDVPIATIMRRLLTGYAVGYNHRHHRHGQLFQNRYKSILCQEEPYLLELVRYIHLNPLRAGLVSSLEGLDAYPYAGHAVVMGKRLMPWQDVDFVLGQFGSKMREARRRYRAFVEQGISQGRRPDLVMGGIMRSSGSWKRTSGGQEDIRTKSDQRILGGGPFVEQVLKKAEECLDRRLQLRMQGHDVGWLADKVKDLLGIDPLQARGKYRAVVEARRIFCYWAVRELGMSATALGKELGITQSAVSLAVKDGEGIVRTRGWSLEVD